MTKIAVVGVGTVGSQVLRFLAEKPGVEVTGYEQFSIGHDRGAAGGDDRIFRNVQYEHPAWVPVAQRADELWTKLSADTGVPIRGMIGCLFLGPEDNRELKNAIRDAGLCGLDHEILSLDDMARRFPQYAMSEGETGILDKNAGYIRSELTILITVLLAEKLGATVHRGTTVLDIVPASARGACVVTERGAEEFDKVVVTTGPWATKLMPGLREHVTIRRPVSAWYTTKPGAPLPSSYPICIRLGPRHIYSAPGHDGLSVKVGVGADQHLVVDNPDGVDRQVNVDQVNYFNEVVGSYLPHLHPEPIRLQSYFEGYLEDARPIVGESPDSDAVYIAVGFSGHGFKISSAMGEVIADKVAGSTPKVNILDFLAREVTTAR